jgi:Fe-S-cluster containining protein
VTNKASDDVSAEIERTAYRQRVETFFACRNAGNTLTLDSLKAGIQLRAIVAAASDLAEYADEALAIVNDEYRPSLHCKEGCSYCCCKPGVLTSIPELLRILDHVRSTFSTDDLSELVAHARRYAGQVAGRSLNELVNQSVPCPFLVEQRCSVYTVRPLTCRGYNSTDLDSCRRAHANTAVLVPIFSMLRDVTDGTTVGAAQALQRAGLNDSLVDLGSALNIALAAGDEFSEAIVNGSALLSAAENSSLVTELWAQVCEVARQVGIEP